MNSSYVNDFSTSVKTYYKDIKKCNPLTREEENILMKKAKNNDINARNKILTSNLKFVFDVAKNYKGKGIPFEDLISEGNLGLIHAFEKFDEKKGVKFISYAVWWIREYIQAYIKERNNENINEISDEELLTPVVQKDCYSDEDLVLNEVIMSNESDLIKKEKQDEIKTNIKRLLNKLDKRERTIVECYFGIDRNKEMNLDEISKFLGLSSERVRQVKSKSLLKLRSEMLLLF